MATDNKFNWKKALEAGALATDALSKGSAGGLGKALVEAKIDLSGKNPTGTPKTKGMGPVNPKSEDRIAYEKYLWKMKNSPTNNANEL